MSKSPLQGELNEECVGDQYMPEWLEAFVKKTFFGPCLLHDLNRNELTRYCPLCSKAFCRFCEPKCVNDQNHKLLKIHHHVHRDVVPLEEIKEYINCVEIQPFKCNNKLVVSLNPLPHLGSGNLLPSDASCRVCKRKLHEPKKYSLCSIGCKVNAFTTKSYPVSFVPVKKSKKKPLTMAMGESSKPLMMAMGESSKHQKRSRKGTPHRAAV